MMHNGWTVSALPKVYPREAYDRAREEVIAKAIKNPDVVALMDFGVEQYPGISDIDFYIIFRKDAKHIFIPFEPGYSDDTEYLLMHTTLLMSEEFLPELRSLNPWSVHAKERYIYKRVGYVPPEIRELPGVDPILSAAFMYDKIESILATLPSFVNKRLPVRNLFELCKNCLYLIWRLDDLGLQSQPKHEEFIQEFDALRDQWFTLPLPEALDRLIAIYTKTLSYTFEIAWMLDGWLASQVSMKPISDLQLRRTRWPYTSAWERKGNVLYVHTYKYARMFTDVPMNPARAMELSVQAASPIHLKLGFTEKKIALTPVILPWRLGAFVTATIGRGGILGTALARDTFTNARELPTLVTPSLQHRIDQQDALTTVYRSKRIPRGEGKGYIYGNQLYGYLFGEERLLRKALVQYVRLRFFKNMNSVAQQ